MPKQTSKSSKRHAAPYSLPPRTRSQTSTPMMSYPLQAAAPVAAHTRPPGWQQQSMGSMHTMPPPQTGYTPRTTTMDRTMPTSPTTPTTPSHGRQSANPSGPWSPQDDEILFHARSQSLGWSQIRKDHFPSKTANACRKRYERLVAKRRGSDWNEERKDRVVNQYNQMREQTWRPLAETVGERWEDVEKLCLERGARNLLPLGQHDTLRAGSEHESRASPDSHEEDRVRISHIINQPS